MSINTVESSKILKALSDSTRLAVIDMLLEKETFVSELIEAIGIEPTLLSHHLSILRNTGIIEAARQGKAVKYQLNQAARIKGKPKAVDFGMLKIEFADSVKEVKPTKPVAKKPAKKAVKKK